MLFKRQKGDWLLVVLIAFALFLYASYQPRLRLSPQMPAEFVEEGADPSKKAVEQKIARVYWSCLVGDVQWRYGFGHTLPADPPLEFNLGMQGKSSVTEDQATRMRYWRQAQRIWYVRSAWQKDYEWDFTWTTNWLQNATDWVQRVFQHMGG